MYDIILRRYIYGRFLLLLLTFLETHCQTRGELDLATMHLTNAVSFDASALYKILASGSHSYKSISIRVWVDEDYLVSSIPVSAILPGVSQVEIITVTTDSKTHPLGITYRLKRALGAPLFSTSLVSVSSPVSFPGPYASEVDLKVHSAESEESDQTEEPSYLKKYWWVFVGMLLLSSVFNKGEAAEAASK